MVKTLKIDDDVHERLTAIGKKGQSYSDIINDLLSGEPFIGRLKEILPITIEKLEANRKDSRHTDLNAADGLVLVAQSIVKTCDERSERKVDFEDFVKIKKKQRALTDAFKKREISNEVYEERQVEILNEFQRVMGEPPLHWVKNEKGKWILVTE